ncbi:MAG: hypothetical protein HND57_07890 [Planctomycetes bacterium]|nr:hypothetical protein [Planctomycetota bacterium]
MLNFAAGAMSLECEYCGHTTPVPQSDEDIRELDYSQHLRNLADREPTDEVKAVTCNGCGAVLVKPDGLDAFACPYCDQNIVATAISKRPLRPKSLLPFKIPRNSAQEAFKQWIASRWFAPSGLKKYARSSSKLIGMYMPHWTYDCRTTTYYTGERGEHYWEDEEYTTTENGKTVTKTRRVQKTAWYPCSGVVGRAFDDVLVSASRSLPDDLVIELEPWDLKSLTPYKDEYLTGFQSESYQIDLDSGFETAKDIMEPRIRQDIRSDIGGDEQQIHTMKTSYAHVTFKLILLPVWISSYRYRDKVYRFLVNARTGEVIGERPWSWIKIIAACVVGAAAVATIAFLYIQYNG